MYADQLAAGAKRSIRDRLNGGVDDDFARSRPYNAKRQRQADDKWKHDLYMDDEEPQPSTKVGPRDLRLKLQQKSSQGPGVNDLRQKLSGYMRPQPATVDPLKTKPVLDNAKTVKKVLASSVEAPTQETRKAANPTVMKKKIQQKADTTVEGLLRSLGLEKYLINFQAEEIDMSVLMHMTDQDLKALGIPMGPRKKIVLALESKA